jgi:hypothetical protein
MRGMLWDDEQILRIGGEPTDRLSPWSVFRSMEYERVKKLEALTLLKLVRYG